MELFVVKNSRGDFFVCFSENGVAKWNPMAASFFDEDDALIIWEKIPGSEIHQVRLSPVFQVG